MKKYIADANFFLRFLLNDIPSQTKIAREYLVDAKKGKLKMQVLPITIFEIHFALTKYYKLKKEEVIMFVKSIVTMSYLDIIDRQSFLSALSLYRKNNIDFVDAYLSSVAQDTNAEILSFDKDFQKIKM